MKLRKLTATFGKLERAVLTPGEGLTVIQAPNEGGKSTWNAFLRAMLYGFPARDRDRNGYLAERNRYQPWSGAPMEGTIELEWRGRELTITRGPRGNVAWGAFSAVYTADQEPVPGMNGDNCGQLLLGVSREVFERTAFLFQDCGEVTPSADLEKRVAALASSGEELVSFSQVERRLRDWINRRRSNSRTGLIPRLEEELAQVTARQAELAQLHSRAITAQRRREDWEAECRRLERQLRAMDHRRRLEAQAQRDAALADCQALEQAMSAIPPAEELRQAQEELGMLNSLGAQRYAQEKELPALEEAEAKARQAASGNPWFRGLEAMQAGDQAERDNHEVKRLSRSPLGWLPPVLGLVLGGAVGWLLVHFITLPLPEHYPQMLPALGGALAGLLVGIVSRAVYQTGRKKRVGEILDRYNASTAEEIYDRADEYEKIAQAAEYHSKQLQEAQERCRQLRELHDEKLAHLLEVVRPFAPDISEPAALAVAVARALQMGEDQRLAQARLEGAERLLAALPVTEDPGVAPEEGLDQAGLSARLEEARSALTMAGDEAARLAGELKAHGDPTELASRSEELTLELEQRNRELAALEAALEGLSRADSLLRERFSPVLNRRAGQYLAMLTGGRYDAAALTREFRALAREAGQTTHRQELSLSGGTAQQLWLALRLALCDLVLPAHEACPIFLDDALDAFDDHRARLALDCLRQVAKTRQVLLFTCHSREQSFLKGLNAVVIGGDGN